MSTATPIPLNVIKHYQQFLDCERSSFGTKPAMAMLYIVALDGHSEVIACPFTDEHEKNMFSLFARGKCKELQATLVLFCSETWGFKTVEDYEDYKANQHRYKGNFGNHPKAIEHLMITIETRTASYIGKTPILKGRKLGASQPLVELQGHAGRMKFL